MRTEEILIDNKVSSKHFRQLGIRVSVQERNGKKTMYIICDGSGETKEVSVKAGTTYMVGRADGKPFARLIPNIEDDDYFPRRYGREFSLPHLRHFKVMKPGSEAEVLGKAVKCPKGIVKIECRTSGGLLYRYLVNESWLKKVETYEDFKVAVQGCQRITERKNYEVRRRMHGPGKKIVRIDSGDKHV